MAFEHLTVGFTGSRKPPTAKQVRWLINRMAETELSPGEVRHGGCRGSDLIMHRIARILDVPVAIHPREELTDAERTVIFADDPGVTVLPGKPPLERNKDIVNNSQILLALPDGPERRRSGTWATIRHALKTGKRVELCFPDGTPEVIDLSGLWMQATGRTG